MKNTTLESFMYEVELGDPRQSSGVARQMNVTRTERRLKIRYEPHKEDSKQKWPATPTKIGQDEGKRSVAKLAKLRGPVNRGRRRPETYVQPRF